MAKEDEVRLIAYSIWEQEGCPNGKDCEHWFRAEVIWETQQKKAADLSKKTGTKQVAQKTSRATPTQKKS